MTALLFSDIVLTELCKSWCGCGEVLLGFQSFKSSSRSVWQSNKETLHRKRPITTSKHLHGDGAYTQLYPHKMRDKSLHKEKSAENEAKLSFSPKGKMLILLIINSGQEKWINFRLLKVITSKWTDEKSVSQSPFSHGLTTRLDETARRITLVLVCAKWTMEKYKKSEQWDRKNV